VSAPRTPREALILAANKIMILAIEADRVEHVPTVLSRMRSDLDLAEQQIRDLRGQA